MLQSQEERLNPIYATDIQDPTEAYAANLKKLLQIEDRKEAIRSAINDEIENLMSPGIMEPIPIHLIRFEHRADIINLWLFHEEKFDSDGKFLKDKCRIVTLSQVRDTSKLVKHILQR